MQQVLEEAKDASGWHPTATLSSTNLHRADGSWCRWQRLGQRFEEPLLVRLLFGQILLYSPIEQPYLTGMDSTQVPRSRYGMVGAGLL